MKFERMMEMNLEANGFGMAEKVSEVDALVFADDQILMDRYAEKENRKNRFKATAMAENRLGDLADYASVVIEKYVGKDGKTKGRKPRNYGMKEYFHGEKAWSKKVRRERFTEEIETPKVCGATLVGNEDEMIFRYVSNLGFEEGFNENTREFEGFYFDDISIKKLCPRFFAEWGYLKRINELEAYILLMKNEIEDLRKEIRDLY